jgi:hypothetical protein
MIQGVLEGKVKLFSADVAKKAVVTLTTKEIVNLLVPVSLTAVFGMPIISKIIKIFIRSDTKINNLFYILVLFVLTIQPTKNSSFIFILA